MAKINLPYVQCVKSRHKLYYRYRRAGNLISLPGKPSDPEFMALYQRVHDQFEAHVETKDVAIPGSIASVILEFKASADWGNLAHKTQRDYAMHLEALREIWGRYQVSSITRKLIMVLRDSLKDKPATANYRLRVARLFLSFAMDRGYITVNPANRPKQLKTGTWEPWSSGQIAVFMKAAAEGDIEQGIVTAVMSAIYTGQREGDILRKSRADIDEKANTITVRQSKTGKLLVIPLHKTYREYLASIPKNTLLLVTQPNGTGYGEDHFRHKLRAALNAIGLKDCVFHGLRKNAVNALLEAGCSTAEVAAITGQSIQMVEHYAKGVNQKRLAKSAIEKLEKDQ